MGCTSRQYFNWLVAPLPVGPACDQLCGVVWVKYRRARRYATLPALSMGEPTVPCSRHLIPRWLKRPWRHGNWDRHRRQSLQLARSGACRGRVWSDAVESAGTFDSVFAWSAFDDPVDGGEVRFFWRYETSSAPVLNGSESDSWSNWLTAPIVHCSKCGIVAGLCAASSPHCGAEPMMRAPLTRSGMTLIEILIALSIFVTISTIMLSVLLGASRLFRAAETSRAANDEALAVFGLLERDLALAIPRIQGGHFYSGITDSDRGTCAIGWTIRDPRSGAAPDDTAFVHWGVSSNGTLRRQIIDSIDDLDADGDGAYDLNPPTGGSIVTNGVRVFSVSMVGTSHTGSGTLVRSTAPEPQTWWASVQADGAVVDSEPTTGGAFYATTLSPTSLGGTVDDTVHAPVAIRVTLLLSGGQRTGTNEPRFGLLGRTAGAASAGDQTIPVVAARGIPSQPGSVAGIGDEIVGFYRVEGAI